MGEVIPGRWRTDTADTVRMYEVNAPGAPSQDFIAREEYLGRQRVLDIPYRQTSLSPISMSSEAGRSRVTYEFG